MFALVGFETELISEEVDVFFLDEVPEDGVFSEYTSDNKEEISPH